MKKVILSTAAFMLVIGTLFTACTTPTEKVENAEINVIKASDDLSTAKENYSKEVAEFRKETADKIAANEKSIADFKVRKENEKQEARADYQKKIIELEQKNTDLKLKMDNYKETTMEEWAKFKVEFEHDMIELGKAFNDLTLKNTQ